jgi:YVTN family beta-propeller protein
MTNARLLANARLRLATIVGSTLGVVLALTSSTAFSQADFVTFESGHVRPLALSPDGGRLYAVNTPDGHLEIFDVVGGNLVPVESVAVGMEPVSVAARSDDEVWVVNHLSDSVSIVDVSTSPARVVKTLLVGDEPRDIVFAGIGGNRAFITTAHRGQHRNHTSLIAAAVPGAGDPDFTTEGIGRADVWVFNAIAPGGALGGIPDAILTFFADTPRALAVSPDGNTVYAAAFHSGNQTTAVNEIQVVDGFGTDGAYGPSDNDAGDPAPEVGIIVKFDGSNWRDQDGNDFSSVVKLELPDHDVFAFNANSLAPSSIPEFDHVGTILFNMAVNPISGKIYVTNTELPNHINFEGPGDHGGSTVQGHLSETRISVLTPSTGAVDPQHLNQHIDYSKLHTDSPDLVDVTAKNHSLATPMQPVVSSDGTKVYMAAFGSQKIGVFDASDLEDPAFEVNFDPTLESANYFSTTGGGPSGLALDETNGRLYVSTRFNNSIEILDSTSGASLGIQPLFNPEPASVVEGRPFLYDAQLTSGNGETSCSSCHIFGDMDDLAWNLGNPDDVMSINPQPSANALLPPETSFHPMKGPMTTQTLRGMSTHGALHWRGDRADGIFGTDACTEPSGAPCDEVQAFDNFIVAFEGLVGRDGLPLVTDMQKFTSFAMQLALPPNPVRNIDNSLTTEQQNGRAKFFSCGDPGDCVFPDPNATDTVDDCDGCHNLDPPMGFFGSGGEQSTEGEPQNFKVPHMRNLYAKIGMFGDSNLASSLGDQVRGFGFLHDGSVGSLFRFLGAAAFTLTPLERSRIEAFALAFPTDFAPAVGQQVTLTSTSNTGEQDRVTLLRDRSKTNYDSLVAGGNVAECDLIVKGNVGGSPRGWVRESGNDFRDDLGNLIPDATLRAFADSDGPLTFTCVAPGSGVRAGINRDRDPLSDGLDNCPGVENPLQEDNEFDGLGDVCDADDDNDDLFDFVETDTGIFVGPDDTGTDPFLADTDGDGFDDGDEVAAGSDPTDAGSTPSPVAVPLTQVWSTLLLIGVLASATIVMRRQRTRST